MTIGNSLVAVERCDESNFGLKRANLLRGADCLPLLSPLAREL